MAQVNFRVTDERLAFIDRAAAIRGVTRTEFVLRSSEAAAVETVNERPVIALDDENCDAGVAAPARGMRRIARHSSEPFTWYVERRTQRSKRKDSNGRPMFIAWAMSYSEDFSA